MATTSDALREALEYHHAGHLQQAEQIYRSILASDPNSAEAWQCLGVLAHQTGHYGEAVKMFERAIQLGLRTPESYNNLGEALRCLEKNQEAANAYQTAIQLNPNYAEALSNLGLLYNSQDRHRDALPLLEKAIMLRPNLANGHLNYGMALANTGKIERAIKHWEIARRLKPGHLLILKNLGMGLQHVERFEESVEVLKELIEKYPDLGAAYSYYGYALASIGKFEEGIAAAKKAVEIVPREQPDLYNILAMTYFRADQLDDALMAAKKAVRLDPGYYNAIVNVGRFYAKLESFHEASVWFERANEIDPTDMNVGQALFSSYHMLKQHDRALTIVEKTLQHHPDHPDLHFNRSTALLALGRYIEGFKEYEWREEHKSFNKLLKNLNRTTWDGSDPTGQSILICSEQGFGDIIQFARYISLVVATGAKVMVDVPWEVRPLIETIPGILRVVPMETELSEFNHHVLLLSLPRIFKTTLETIPAKVPYLHADALHIEKWKPVIDAHARGLKVGIVWGGNAVPDHRRSTTLKAMLPLADVPNISWYSLQVGQHREQLKDAAPQMDILDLGKDFKDFADTAAVLSQLDLVITIDTSAAHLAGAMALNAWIMLPYSADWRWMTEGDTTPWYPTLRLFRQEKADEWRPVIEEIRNELLKRMESRRS